ncbi:MAG TPA: hypothetical protein VJV78_25180 [Polyangiales bacterium]|nr:hypothetical protein [Polyangiales bacterium]
MKMSVLRTSLALVLMAIGAGCGGSDDNMDGALSNPMDGEDADTSCPADTPPFDFGPMGLSATNEAAGVKVYLETASDKPPFYGPNDWTIAFTDLEGKPASNALLTWACAFMPKHGHGSSPKSVNNLGSGRYELLRQNMAMQGGWEIRLWVDMTGAGKPFEGGGVGINRAACAEPRTEPTLKLLACVPR